jgi:hypothetical protein
MLWYSGFLPYHKELVEGSEKCNTIERESTHFFQRTSSRSNYRTSDPVSLNLMDEIINEEENSIVVVDTNPWKKYKRKIFIFANQLWNHLE